MRATGFAPDQKMRKLSGPKRPGPRVMKGHDVSCPYEREAYGSVRVLPSRTAVAVSVP